jgi:hypothetical protein
MNPIRRFFAGQKAICAVRGWAEKMGKLFLTQ